MDGQQILVYVLATTSCFFFFLFIFILVILIWLVFKTANKSNKRSCCYCPPKQKGKGGARETTINKKHESTDVEEGNAYFDLTDVVRDNLVTETEEWSHRHKKVHGKKNCAMVSDEPGLPPRQPDERDRRKKQSDMVLGLHPTDNKNSDDEDIDEDDMTDILYANMGDVGSFGSPDPTDQNSMNSCNHEVESSNVKEMIYDKLPPPRPVKKVTEEKAALSPKVQRKS